MFAAVRESAFGPSRHFAAPLNLVAIGGIADILQHWHEMARSRMTPTIGLHFARRESQPRSTFSAAVITDADQHIVGILSERDIVRTLARNIRAAGACHLCDEAVGQVMTREVETCTPSDTIHVIMERMTTGKFRHLPVVEGGKLAGIVSIGDAVNHQLREMELESKALHEYILTA